MGVHPIRGPATGRGCVWEDRTGAAEEACLVLLSGTFRIRWEEDGREHSVGPRASVFSGYPHAVYLPAGTAFGSRPTS